MGKVFEDEFMELQSGLISLCLEVTKGKVDKVYAYASNERYSKSFNAFFEHEGQIKTLNLLDVPRELVSQFLMIGTKDLLKLDAIGKKYNRPVPTELKLYYDVRNGKFNAEYKYEEICSAKTGVISDEVFRNWVVEMRNQLKN